MKSGCWTAKGLFLMMTVLATVGVIDWISGALRFAIIGKHAVI